MTGPQTELTAVTLPDSAARERFEALVGLDEVKRSLAGAISIMLKPEKLQTWASKHRVDATAVKALAGRAPLFILGGDVGTGKTELAETIGDFVGRAERMEILLYRLGLTARGGGLVGEMTQRLSAAFASVASEAKKWKGASKRTGAVLFIDEADAIAQSRSTDQMHHEDRAGVNALIRAVDDIARDRLPVVIIMATNRLDAIDPAVRRRAANVYEFARPDESQRDALFARLVPSVKMSAAEHAQLLSITGSDTRGYGFSYSDIVRRLVPEMLLAALEADLPPTAALLIHTAKSTAPTPPFGSVA
jgi:SpoVK/Ycf46/Vps4 family AAA+-type ATPase